MQIRKAKSRQETTEEEASLEAPPKDEHAEELKAKTDDLLADIDDLLAGIDAKTFVDSYVQKGGE